jgi:hypothetical protein
VCACGMCLVAKVVQRSRINDRQMKGRRSHLYADLVWLHDNAAVAVAVALLHHSYGRVHVPLCAVHLPHAIASLVLALCVLDLPGIMCSLQCCVTLQGHWTGCVCVCV